MKNNKGFAITSTIYGFLILFLIILLSVLSVMRSQNNRSIIISDKISKNAFINIEDKDAITVDPQVANDFSMVTSRGKYYARIMKGATIEEDCYFYFPDNGIVNLEGGSLKINNNNAIIYNKEGNKLENSSITEAIITKYYVENKLTASFDLNYFNQDMNGWYFVNEEQFKTINIEDNDMNYLSVDGVSGKWEQILFPIPVEKDSKYTISFDYSIPNNYSTYSTYSGIGYQVLNEEPSNSNNINSDILVTSGYLPTEKTSSKQTAVVDFTAQTTGIYYFNFNFGMAADNKTVNVYLGNFKIFSNIVKRKTISFNSEIGNLDTPPTRIGYNFKGWYDQRKDGNKIEVNTLIPYNNITYYAGWSKNSTPINVIYDNNYLKGDFSGETYNLNNYETYQVNYWENPKEIFLANAKGNKLLEFKINNNGNGDGGIYYNSSQFENETKKLEDGKQYTWSLYVKSNHSKNINIGSEQGGIKAFYVTENWEKITNTFTATTYNPMLVNFVFYKDNWEQDEVLSIHSFEIAEGDGSGNTNSQNKIVGDAFGSFPTNPTRPKHEFIGWYSDPLLGYQIRPTSIVQSSNDKYYAHWKYTG